MKLYTFLCLLFLALPTPALATWWPDEEPEPTPEAEVYAEAYSADDYATKHAESAPPSSSASEAVASPCGDATGVSGQIGVAGAGLATITETCRAYRLQRLQKAAPEATSTKLATITHYAGWFPRLVIHLASFGILN